MGRVGTIVVVTLTLTGCEPTPVELFVEHEGDDDWMLVATESRQLLLRRLGPRSEISHPYSDLPLDSQSIHWGVADGQGEVQVYPAASIVRYRGFLIERTELTSSLEVVSSGGRPAGGRCCVPQTNSATLLVPGAACPTPSPSRRFLVQGPGGAALEVQTSAGDEGHWWLLDRSGPSPCRAFVGTEGLLPSPPGPTPAWRPVEGLRLAGDLQAVRMAGGQDSFAVVTASGAYRVSPTAQVEQFGSARAGGAEFVTDWHDGDGRHGFWIGLSPSEGLKRWVETYQAGPVGVRHVATATVPAESGWSADRVSLAVWGAPNTLIWSTSDWGVGQLVMGLSSGDVRQLKPLEFRSAQHAGPRPSAVRPEGPLMASRARGSTWLAWASAEGVRVAWVLPVMGETSATVYSLEGLPEGSLERIVALDDDRVVLVLSTEAGLIAWEWLQLPAQASHPYDQGCARTDGRFCLRPYPTGPALDGRVPCAGSTPVIHAWGSSVGGLRTLFSDGRMWGALEGCLQTAMEDVARGATAANGATLALDTTGRLWILE